MRSWATVKLQLTNCQRSSTVIVSKPAFMKSETNSKVNITVSVRFLGWNVKSKAWKKWPPAIEYLIRELINQGDMVSTACGHRHYYGAVFYQLFLKDAFRWTWNRIVDDPFYVYSRCARCITVKTVQQLLDLFLYILFYVCIYESAGAHIL